MIYRKPPKREVPKGCKFCERCSGWGFLPPKKDNIKFPVMLCYKCRGLGIISWIQEIFGVN